MPKANGHSSTWLSLGILAAGCSGAGNFASLDHLPSTSRRPDGVMIDPLPAPTSGQEHGTTKQRYEVALVPPLPFEAAQSTVHSLMEAIAQEDLTRLFAVVMPGATWSNPLSVGKAMPQQALSFWKERFRRFDYTQLQKVSVYQQSDVEVFSLEDLDNPALDWERPSRPFDMGAPEMGSRDILLRIPILTPHLGPDRLFGDEISIILHPDKGVYRVQSAMEEFAIP